MKEHYATREQLQQIIDTRTKARWLSQEALRLALANRFPEADELRRQATTLRKQARRASRELWGN